LASSLAAAAVAVAFVYGLRSHPAASPVEVSPSPPATAEEQHTPPTETEQDASAVAPTLSTATPAEPSPSDPVDQRRARRTPPLDEATARELDRRHALDEVRIAYTLLLDDLDLPEQDEKDLIALLVDMRLESAWTSYQNGRTISAEERSDRISAVIGPEKHEQFLALEKNGREYWETYQIALLLQRRGVPTTPAQRDGVFDILTEVRDRYPVTRPEGLDPNSLEYLEYGLTQLDEFDRHVIELAPSVLSPRQVVHLFNEYDYMRRERASSLEQQRKSRIDRPDDTTFGPRRDGTRIRNYRAAASRRLRTPSLASRPRPGPRP
jgi:hypothetical protein